MIGTLFSTLMRTPVVLELLGKVDRGGDGRVSMTKIGAGAMMVAGPDWSALIEQASSGSTGAMFQVAAIFIAYVLTLYGRGRK